MKLLNCLLIMAGLTVLGAESAEVVAERNDESSASPAFRFKNVPRPAKLDAGSVATFKVARGEADRNGGSLSALNNGELPQDEDQPRRNFFFAAGSEGGRLVADLGEVKKVRQVNSYSWHPGERAAQLYVVHGARELPADADLSGANLPGVFREIAKVDTRTTASAPGGQHGVSVRAESGELGEFRYLLFEVARTEGSPFAHTFFSEIDIVAAGDPEEAPEAEADLAALRLEIEDGPYRYTFDMTAAPDLADWTKAKLVPVVKEWYPKIVAMLPSEGFQPTTNVLIRYRTDMGGTPASAGGSRVNCNAQWFRRELDREAAGSVVHELVHVVQSYGWGRRQNPDASRTPGWITEGIPDYIRWFLYEPQTKGAEITKNNLARAKHDASYRITGNFLNWVEQKHGPGVIKKVNAAARAGKYDEAIWKELTGKTVEELGGEWRAFHEERLKAAE